MIKNILILRNTFTLFFVLSFYLSYNPISVQAVGDAALIVPAIGLTTAEVSIVAGAAPPNTGANIANAGTNAAKLSWDVTGKNLLDAAAYAAAQNLLGQLTQNTIAWIRGGFHGSPSFAVDTNQILTELADNIAGGMVLSLRNLSVCNFSATYKDDLVNTVDISAKKRPYIYNQKAACPFKEDFEFKASDFYSGASKFGWGAMGAALSDGGNAFSLQKITAQEQADREAAAKASKEQRLSWSNGFTDIVDVDSCDYPPTLFHYENDPKTNTFNERLPIITAEEAQARNAELQSDPAFVKSIQDQYCKKTTPGKIVGDQLTQTLGLDMDRLGFADNMNKIVSAFLDVLTQKTIRSVFGGSKSVDTGNRRSAGAGETPVVIVSTLPATNITKDSATLHGSLTYAGPEAVTSAWFVLGNTEPTSTLSESSNAVNDKPFGSLAYPIAVTKTKLPQAFSKTVTGLAPNTVYYFSINAKTSQAGALPSNLHGTGFSFRTPSATTTSQTQ